MNARTTGLWFRTITTPGARLVMTVAAHAVAGGGIGFTADFPEWSWLALLLAAAPYAAWYALIVRALLRGSG